MFYKINKQVMSMWRLWYPLLAFNTWCSSADVSPVPGPDIWLAGKTLSCENIYLCQNMSCKCVLL